MGKFLKFLFDNEDEENEDEEEIHGPILGTGKCMENGCVQVNASQCAYIDRRARECETCWCPDHHLPLQGKPYCRRHYGIMKALSGAKFNDQLPPDLENRAPSLVEWVANGLEDDVMALLEKLKEDRKANKVMRMPLLLALYRQPAARIWVRTWQLADANGPTLKVQIMVDEEKDIEVIIRVDSETMIRLVPPWILQRQNGEVVSKEEDLARRDIFRNKLLDAVARGITGARAKKF
jgi:hypothetical protein